MSNNDCVSIKFINDGREYNYFRSSITGNAPETIFGKGFGETWDDKSEHMIYRVDRDIDIFHKYIDPYLRGYGRVWEACDLSEKEKMMLEQDLCYYGIPESERRERYSSFTELKQIADEALKVGLGDFTLGPFKFKDIKLPVSYEVVPNYGKKQSPFKVKHIKEVKMYQDVEWHWPNESESDEQLFYQSIMNLIFKDDDYKCSENFNIWIHKTNDNKYIKGALKNKQGIPELGISKNAVAGMDWDDFIDGTLTNFGGYVSIWINPQRKERNCTWILGVTEHDEDQPYRYTTSTFGSMEDFNNYLKKREIKKPVVENSS